ncbi:M42 family metallopeptidase [Desulfitobacterium sp.]|uniref:M42 family metallopeptidase n=1 Tax=Desulfitobacterium sp. TaxID=49981 RepID=UPI002CCF88EC|nr:M42 family metallopeptidase [Desulfitobacterium sp.]HVJ48627.1 M42 family metallopeptidase [Desulfitobacterium sp.]
MSNAQNLPDYTLLERLSQAYGPSGAEKGISEKIAAVIQPYCDSLTQDKLGNLIAIRKGSGKKIMIATHMDEIGVMITHIDENGFLRFTTVGGVHVAELPHRRVQFQNGRTGIISMEKLDKPSDLKLSRLYLDIGAANQEEAEQIVQIGDSAVFTGELVHSGSRILSKALDNRVGCFVAIEALKRVQTEHELSFAFTVQEEVGLRGAQTAAFALDPDVAIAVDVTLTGDTPKAHPMEVKLGNGVAIKVFDHSMITPPQIKQWMTTTAEKYKIPYQFEVLEFGGTDSGAIHLTKGGIPAGVLSIPTRYVHSPSEMIDSKDVEAAVNLLVALLEGPINL